jgi:carboxypeptidase family protein
MRLRPKSILLLSVLLAMVSPELKAQTTTSGGLTGVVTDPSHAVVPHAGIEIKNDAQGSIQSTKTDREGVYQFSFQCRIQGCERTDNVCVPISSKAVAQRELHDAGLGQGGCELSE